MVSWIYANRVKGASQKLAQELKGLPGVDSNILHNLSGESDSSLYWSDLLTLGREAESQRNYPLARGIYQNISQRGPSEDFKSEARARLAVLNGGGTAAERLEFLGGEFLPQVTDPSLIAGMWVAGRCFRGIQQGLLPLFAPQTWAGHSAIWGTAFAGEVGGFVLAGRGVRSLQGHEVDWTASGLSHDLRHAGLGLLGLKAFGLGTLHFLGPLAKSTWFARALPTTAMAAGVMGSRALELQMGWLPPQNAEQFLLDSAVTVLHFQALHGMFSTIPSPAENTPPLGRRWAPQVRRLAVAGVDSQEPSSLVFTMASSSPKPPPAEVGIPEGESPVRTPKSSGVRPMNRENVYSDFKRRLDGIEGEIQLLFLSPDKPTTWLNNSIEIQDRMVIESRYALEIIRTTDPQSAVLPTLERIHQEAAALKEQMIKLQEQEKQQGSDHLSPSIDDIKAFIRNLYAFPNKLVNFMDGTDTIEPVLHVLMRMRLSLENISEIESVHRGPVLPEKWNQEIMDASHNVSTQLFILFSPRGLTGWEHRAHLSAKDFSLVLKQTLARLRELEKPELYHRETQKLDEEVGQIVTLLQGRLDRGISSPTGSYPEGFLANFYQAPTSFVDFLLDGDVRLLRTARIHSHRAREILEELPE
jgi:hypothetical protein